jgi:hypothetical protein
VSFIETNTCQAKIFAEVIDGGLAIRLGAYETPVVRFLNDWDPQIAEIVYRAF